MRVLPAKAGAVVAGATALPLTAPGHGRLAELRELRGPAVTDFTRQVRCLIVIVSSSRGGSSMLTEMLRSSDGLVHLRAEFNPFLRIAGLDFPASGTGSDALGPEHVQWLDPTVRQVLDRELALDAGMPAARIADTTEFELDAAWRFFIQWPHLDLGLAEWTAVARAVLGRLRERHGWAPDELPDVGGFQAELIDELRARSFPVNPRFYDLPERLFPHAACPDGPPGPFVIEEPPFVLPRPWRRATAADLAANPLVVKAPSNAYRMDFLRALFPNARLRVLHLTRNPAASVNGLYDGWQHPGFHAHRLADPLRIKDYASHSEEERHWWKFDLPPGWEALADRPLTDVCAFQWRSCHEAILSDVANGSADYLRVRFEDVIRGADSRVQTVRRIADWLGVPFDGGFSRTVRDGIGPVVATAPPSPHRWRRRARLIHSSLDQRVLATAEELGYGSEADWI
ncbi:sulfotransferase family protein [Micromonospora maritima]|uniref:Sulfotransferase family protein n=1 Tax=Micromonospora maritima TaxID=986711 RepID=A0ABW7ZGZ9_9ACTN